MPTDLSALTLSNWRGTRDTLHAYARLVGALRAALMPPQKHWWHITLQPGATGLTTGAVPVAGGALEVYLDLMRHRLQMLSSVGEQMEFPLRGQPVASLLGSLRRGLETMGIHAALDDTAFEDPAPREYDPAAAERFWQVLCFVHGVYQRFKNSLREETGPVHVFPHHFDLSLNWFSGRRVPGVDPADEESADEQMNFGFLTGDDTIPEPYYYVTAYPQPPGMLERELPQGARWQTQGFTGAVLAHDVLVRATDPAAELMGFLQATQGIGAELMRP